MSNNVEVVRLGVRIPSTLKTTLNKIAEKTGVTPSKLGRIAVRLYLHKPPTQTPDIELAELTKRFTCGQTENYTIALSGEESKKLREYANKIGKNTSQTLTLALGNLLNELETTILEESFKIAPHKNYEKAVEAGIITPSNPQPIKENPPKTNPNKNPDKNPDNPRETSNVKENLEPSGEMQ